MISVNAPDAPITFELTPHDLDVAMRELWESAPRGTGVAASRRNSRLGPIILLAGVWLAGAIIILGTILLHDPRRPPPHAVDIVTSSIPFVVLGALGAWALRWKLHVSRWVARTLRAPQTRTLLQPQQLELTDQGLAHTIGDQRAVYGWGSIQEAVAGKETVRVVLSHERHVFIPRRAFANPGAADGFITRMNTRPSRLQNDSVN